MIKWESCLEKYRNQNLTSSKRGLHSIESSIAAEPMIAHLMRRLELLEAKEPVLVNQVSPPQVSTPGCTYYQAMNHVFEECLVFLADQMLPNHMNAVFSWPHNNSFSQTYNLGLRNHPNFPWKWNNHEHQKSNFPTQFPAHNYQSNFKNQIPQPSFQHPHSEKKLTELEKSMETLIKS